MAHQNVTFTPVALAGVAADTTYFLRNTGGAEIRVAIQASAPARDQKDAFPVPPGGDLYPTPEAGESIWVWATAAFSEVVFVEAN